VRRGGPERRNAPAPGGPPASGPSLKLPVFLKLTNADPFAAWFVVTGDATPDGIRVVRSVLGAIRKGERRNAPALAGPPAVQATTSLHHTGDEPRERSTEPARTPIFRVEG